jgi:hypothetical protein
MHISSPTTKSIDIQIPEMFLFLISSFQKSWNFHRKVMFGIVIILKFGKFTGWKTGLKQDPRVVQKKKKRIYIYIYTKHERDSNPRSQTLRDPKYYRLKIPSAGIDCLSLCNTNNKVCVN